MLLATETEYLNLNEACQLFPGSPHITTVRRYASRGVNGTKLRVVRSAGKSWTTAEWVREFLESSAINSREVTTSTESTRTKRLKDARRRLVNECEIGVSPSWEDRNKKL